MNRIKPGRILMVLGLIAASVFAGSTTATADTESQAPTAPTNVRAVVDSGGQVTAIEWDASSGGAGPITYHVFLDGSEIDMAWGLRVDLPPSCLFECQAGAQTSVPVVVTAKSAGVESPPSEAIILCFN